VIGDIAAASTVSPRDADYALGRESDMRVIVALIVGVVVGFVWTSPVYAAESQDAFAKRVGKYATVDTSRPKGLCWCKDGFNGAGTGEAGYVVQQVTSGQVGVSCQIPEFNRGANVGFAPCVVEWDMLGK
jgi:hypothetical protein